VFGTQASTIPCAGTVVTILCWLDDGLAFKTVAALQIDGRECVATNSLGLLVWLKAWFDEWEMNPEYDRSVKGRMFRILDR
jgi:hypothetical protein